MNHIIKRFSADIVMNNGFRKSENQSNQKSPSNIGKLPQLMSCRKQSHLDATSTTRACVAALQSNAVPLFIGHFLRESLKIAVVP